MATGTRLGVAGRMSLNISSNVHATAQKDGMRFNQNLRTMDIAAKGSMHNSIELAEPPNAFDQNRQSLNRNIASGNASHQLRNPQQKLNAMSMAGNSNLPKRPNTNHILDVAYVPNSSAGIYLQTPA